MPASIYDSNSDLQFRVFGPAILLLSKRWYWPFVVLMYVVADLPSEYWKYVLSTP